MFTNREGCTLYEKTIHNRAPTFIRRELGAVYWEEKQEQNSGADRSPRNEVFVSIPVTSVKGYIPQKDDRIVGEIISDEQPPNTAMTIMSVSDFLYGSPSAQHIEVIAK